MLKKPEICYTAKPGYSDADTLYQDKNMNGGGGLPLAIMLTETRRVSLVQGYFFGVYEKTQGEKTQTQGKWIKNSRIFSMKTQEIGNSNVNCRQNL